MAVLPFSDVENSWTLEEQNLKSIFDAVVADVLEGPVPVVVVEVAKVFSTSVDLLPQSSIERHPHVVLCAHPLRQLDLKWRENNFKIEKIIKTTILKMYLNIIACLQCSFKFYD